MREVERSELQAIDAALAGGVVAAEHAELAELTRALRSLRARPSETFIRTLDARAADGFRADRVPAGAPLHRSRTPAPRAPRPGGHSAQRRFWIASGAVAAAIVAAVVAIAGFTPGRSTKQPRGGAAVTLKVEGQSVTVPSGSSIPAASSSAGSGAAVQRVEVPAGRAAQARSEASAPARQVERGSTLDVGVAPGAVQSSAQRVFSIAAEYGGYVTQSNVSSGSVGQSYASFQLRLPSGRLAAAISTLSHLGRVRSETDTTNDVTGEYDSLTRTLGDLRAERASLLREIAATTEAGRLASLRERLHALESRIGAEEGSLHALQQRVAFSPLALSLTAEAGAGGSSSGSSLTPGSALDVAGEILTAGVAVLVIALAAAVPLGLVLLAAAATFGRSRRHARERALDAG